MGSDYLANFAYCVSEEDLERFLPEEFNAFQTIKVKCIDILEFDFNQFAFDINIDENQTLSYWFLEHCHNTHPNETTFRDQFIEALNALKEAFKQKTTIAPNQFLELHCNYHDPDTGSEYDEVDGIYWSVTGVMVLSPAAEAFQRKGFSIDENWFCTYG